jgi:hypothetical protein
VCSLDHYRDIWLVDTEFSQPPGERPDPICLVARELRSGQTIRLWQDELARREVSPYPIDADALFVAYLASAELGCHLALGWPLPTSILDLYVEFRHLVNGFKPSNGFGLLGALAYHGLDALDATQKKTMQLLAARGGPWSATEQQALLDYCETDVAALEKLLPAMLPKLDVSRAVACRGRYMAAVAWMEYHGVPIDTDTLARLRYGWSAIQGQLIQEVDSHFGVFEGRTFKEKLWADWVARRGLAWPKLESGELALDEDVFRQMARSDPDVALMHELRVSLSKLRLNDLAVGEDGRNRTMLSPFGAKSGRNTPSNSQFVFGPSTWIRGLIRPEEDRAVAYVDWSQQEFGIAASLSGDDAMLDAYTSGDPYLKFGQQAGRIPADGTKKTHPLERELFKTCILGVNYGMGPESLAQRIGRPLPYARDLLRLHHDVYWRFWAWSDGAEMYAMLHNRLFTVFGWAVHVGQKANPRSLRNFPVQGAGAEMLRLACCLVTEEGINVAAPVHDALLIEASVDEIDETVARTQELMARASSIVLSGFELRSDAQVVHYPDRYMDVRGEAFWARVMTMLPTEIDDRPRRHSPIPCTIDPDTGAVRGHVDWVGAF